MIFMSGIVTIAQTPDFSQHERELIKLHDKMYEFVNRPGDSLNYYSKKFDMQFMALVKNNSQTLTYPFDLLKHQGIHIQTSADGKFRIYSWDNRTGGSWHQYSQIFQFESNKKIFTLTPDSKEDEGDSNGFCSGIITLNLQDKTVYLCTVNYIFSSVDRRQALYAYRIYPNGLIEALEIFEDDKGRHRKLYVDYNSKHLSNALDIISWNKEKNTIYLPMTDEKGNVTKKHALYKLKDDSLIRQ